MLQFLKEDYNMPTKKTELPVEEGMELGSQMSDTPIPQTETEISTGCGIPS